MATDFSQWSPEAQKIYQQKTGQTTYQAPQQPTKGNAPPPTPSAPETPTAAPSQPEAPQYAPPAQAPAGYDATKWSDPNHTTAKYVAGRTVAGGGDINATIQALTAAGHQVRPVEGSHDQLYYFDPNVGHEVIIDVMGDNQQAYWYPTFGGQYGYTPPPGDPNSDGTYPAGTGPTSGGSGGGGFGGLLGNLSGFLGGSGGNVGSGFSQSGPVGYGTDQWNSLLGTLMGRYNQPLNFTDQDPIIRAQSEAFANSQSRAQNSYLADAAERGGPFENMNSERRLAAEKVGMATSQFEAELMGRELMARRQEIEHALTTAAGMLTEQQRVALSRELGLIDAALGYAGLQQRAYEFDTDDEFRRSPLASGQY